VGVVKPAGASVTDCCARTIAAVAPIIEKRYIFLRVKGFVLLEKAGPVPDIRN
jgi:hypothetical protein